MFLWLEMTFNPPFVWLDSLNFFFKFWREGWWWCVGHAWKVKLVLWFWFLVTQNFHLILNYNERAILEVNSGSFLFKDVITNLLTKRRSKLIDESCWVYVNELPCYSSLKCLSCHVWHVMVFMNGGQWTSNLFSLNSSAQKS